MINENFTKGFCRMTCQNYYNPEVYNNGKSECINIEKRSLLGGIEYEFHISWYNQLTKPAVKLEIFNDAFIAIKDNESLIKILSQLKEPTPDDIHRLLLDLGYVDFSDKKLNPKGKAEISTYICYVQNYLGIMDGEDVVSNMEVFTNQEDIDYWLTEQLAEAKEMGFEPEDDPFTYYGINDYELHMSKGNEEEGFINYGLICKPYRMKM